MRHAALDAWEAPPAPLVALRREAARDGQTLVPETAAAAWREVATALSAVLPAAAADDARAHRGGDASGAPGGNPDAAVSGDPSGAERGDAKALVAALRQQGLCTLDEAHALLDFHALTRRVVEAPTVLYPAGESARAVLVRAECALARVLRTARAEAQTAPLRGEYASSASASAASASASASAASASASASAATASAASASASASAAGASASAAVPDRDAVASPGAGGLGTRRSSAFVVGFVVVCLLAAGIAALLFSGVGRDRPLDEGIAAYAAGQRMVARLAFEKALAASPHDARPLLYLGRLAREEGDLPQSRRLLEQAVQRAPDNPLAHRELASALLADGQPELARRFYVRALTLDPNDRLAQGFLGCALLRLGRAEEAQRWFERAGPGDWLACVATAPSLGPPGPGRGP
jgi:tetratricopeptide (TPR) repeat protein